MDARTRMIQMRAVDRLAARDATLFVDPEIAAHRLGWIGLPADASAHAAELTAIGNAVTEDGIRDVVLLGMGGSSLAPLVLSRILRSAPGAPALHVLDTTSPAAVTALMTALRPTTTLVVVSSKSGTTIEPLTLAAILREWMEPVLGTETGAHFMAVTDAGSPLESFATQSGFARVFTAPADVGGRYAALTPFGMVPAALSGLDTARLAAAASAMEARCSTGSDDNPALALGAWLADCLAAGRDKLTIISSAELAPFGLWIEQLVAESTGKQDGGLLPVLEDAPGNHDAHGPDRMTFTLRTVAEPAFAVLHSGLPTDEPVFEVVLDDAWRIAGEFIRWEWAVALFSALCGIEPFDQPNVAEAKAATEAILLNGAPESSPASIPVTSGGSDPVSIDALVPALSDLLTGASPGAYLAVLAYLPDDAALLAPLSDACAALAASRRIAVTLELGPRYLHSTGQYHKGGSPKGLFLVITAGGADDVRVPDKPYTLGVLNRAQAMGDLMTLASHGRPVIHVVLPDPGAVHIEAVAEALRAL